jgi:hypothetical protein
MSRTGLQEATGHHLKTVHHHSKKAGPTPAHKSNEIGGVLQSFVAEHGYLMERTIAPEHGLDEQAVRPAAGQAAHIAAQHHALCRCQRPICRLHLHHPWAAHISTVLTLALLCSRVTFNPTANSTSASRIWHFDWMVRVPSVCCQMAA